MSALVALGDDRYRLGELVIDLARWEAIRGGAGVPLTVSEFRLLSALIRARGQMLRKDQLFDVLWDFAEDVHSRAIDMHVARLRKKIGQEAIRTFRAVGYALNCEWAPGGIAGLPPRSPVPEARSTAATLSFAG